jgi:hypothetical protein
MKTYSFSTLGGTDSYGFPQVSNIAGFVKMSIYLYTQNVTDNIKFRDATYIGFTHDKTIADNYIVNYEDKRLKVLYVNPVGRFNQVYLKEVDNGRN